MHAYTRVPVFFVVAVVVIHIIRKSSHQSLCDLVLLL